jgi:hypothetical protein
MRVRNPDLRYLSNAEAVASLLKAKYAKSAQGQNFLV